MRPSANVRLSLPWLPRSDAKAYALTIMRSIVIALHNKRAAILLPARKKLRVSVTQAPVVTLAKQVRNAPAFHKLLGNGVPCEFVCSQFPNLPKYPSPDGLLHMRAPQGT